MNTLWWFLTMILLPAAIVSGCALNSPRPPTASAAVSCLEAYAALDAAVAEAGTTPSSPARIASFPYLRVDRFLAGYRELAVVADRRSLARRHARAGSTRDCLRGATPF